MHHCFRLKPGEDLKEKIETFALENKISGVILCCVGSLTKVALRMADSSAVTEKTGHFEIVSATGTLSPDGVHIHLSVSDEEGVVFGGHLKNGCTIYTTAEIAILSYEDIKFSRPLDPETGFEELSIEYKG